MEEGLRELPVRSRMESADCRHPNFESFSPTQYKNGSRCFSSAKLSSDLEQEAWGPVSYWDYLSAQIPALTSPAHPPIIRPCLAPMPYAASRATLPPTATSISTTSSKGIARSGAAVPVASLPTSFPPTGAPCSPSKFSSCNQPSMPGQSRTAALFQAARNMPSPRCAFFRLSMKAPSRLRQKASQPGKWSSTNPTLKHFSGNWESSLECP